MTSQTLLPGTPGFIQVERIRPSTDNLRAGVGDVTELAASIKAVGMLEPLVVVPADGPDGGTFQIVMGHRRYAAALVAGLEVVPAITRVMNERERVEAMLVENLQREDLTPLEEAEGYRRLIGLGLGQVELAKRVGRSQAHVSKRLALLKLPEAARAALAIGGLQIADALELVPHVGDPEVITRTLKYAGERNGNLYPGQVKRLAETAAEEIKEERARKTALEGLAAAKVSILKTDQYGHPAGHVTRLGKGWREIPMTPAAHKKEPCHAAYVTRRGEVVYVCTQPANHLKAEAKAVAKAAREIAGVKTGAARKLVKASVAKAAETRERNKVLRTAAPIRRKLAAALVKPSKVRAEAREFALRQLIQTTLDREPNIARIAAELLGVKAKTQDGDPSFRSFTSPAQIDQLAYALALAAGEAPFVQLDARGYFSQDLASHAARYFAHLKAANYKATPAELAQIKPTDWRPAFDGAGK